MRLMKFVLTEPIRIGLEPTLLFELDAAIEFQPFEGLEAVTKFLKTFKGIVTLQDERWSFL